jgi:hypothetical protein
MPAELDRDETVRRNRRFFDGLFGPDRFYFSATRAGRTIGPRMPAD